MTNNLPVDERSWTLATVATHAKIVKKGVRPIAEIVIRNEYRVETEDELQRLEMNWVDDMRGETHRVYYVFQPKQSHVANVIRHLIDLDPPEPFCSWAWGHLFGYRESEIGDYLQLFV